MVMQCMCAGAFCCDEYVVALGSLWKMSADLVGTATLSRHASGGSTHIAIFGCVCRADGGWYSVGRGKKYGGATAVLFCA